MLDHKVRPSAVENRAEPANDHRMGHSLKHLGFLRQLTKRSFVIGLIGAQNLGHGDREKLVIPDEVHLIARPPANRLEHASAIDQKLPLIQIPARPVHAATIPASRQPALVAGISRETRPVPVFQVKEMNMPADLDWDRGETKKGI